MMLSTLLGAMTLAALGPNHANYYTNDRVSTPEVVEIRPDLVDRYGVDRNQVRFSNRTRGTVVAVSNSDGSMNWNGASDREKLGGQNAPAMIYVRIFDGLFAIDPFVPLPAANDATAQMLFRGTTLQTDQAFFGQHEIDRTKELFAKLEQARHNWLRDNGYFSVRVYTNPNPVQDEHAKGKSLPEPSAVFERPADLPRTKSNEQVKGNDQSDMPSIAQVLKSDGEVVRISMPHTASPKTIARVEKMNKRNAERAEENVEVAINDQTEAKD